MKKMPIMAIIAVSAFAFSGRATALAPEIDDLLGRWCQSDGPSYTFTRTTLEVIWSDGRKKTMQISKIEPSQDLLKLYWGYKTKDGLDASTDFRVSDDKRLLIQDPNVDANGKPIGDQGPRREFRRC